MAQLSELTARAYGIHDDAAKRLYTAALLHDIGKTALPDSIVRKPGRLTPEEFEILKTHTKLGAEMLSSIKGNLGIVVRTVCELHHENWDGSGYWSKNSSETPLYVSIVSIADVFVALCSPSRPYKTAWTPEKAMEYIRSQAGKQFSPALAGVFLQLVKKNENLPALLAGIK